MAKIFFYSPVSNTDLFKRVGFYATDIQLLRDLGHIVIPTNSLLDFFKFWRYDVAFFYFYTWSAFGAIISRLLMKRVIATGGADQLEVSYNRALLKASVHRLLFRFLYGFANRVLVVSSTDWRNMSDIVGSKNLILAPHCVDTAVFKPGASRNMNCMLTIGWMATEENVRRKGMDDAVRVFAAYRKIIPEARLIIAGTEGYGTDLLRKLAKQLGVSTAIEFRFGIDEDEKVRLLQTSGFYFQLSEFEGFGLAALEALSCGSCVVHTGRGGLVDFMHSFGIHVTWPVEPDQVARALLEAQAREVDVAIFATDRHAYVQEGFALKKRRDVLSAAIST